MFFNLAYKNFCGGGESVRAFFITAQRLAKHPVLPANPLDTGSASFGPDNGQRARFSLADLKALVEKTEAALPARKPAASAEPSPLAKKAGA